jgi:hypothetical protein
MQNDILESEEAYFLRRVNGRSNARLLLSLAQEFGLNIPSVNDPCAYDPCRIASTTTETFINDMARSSLHSGCRPHCFCWKLFIASIFI